MNTINKQNKQKQKSPRPNSRPKLVEHSGAMFLDGIRIYSIDLDGQLQKSINEYKTKNDCSKNDCSKNDDINWSSFFELQIEKINLFFSNTYESIYLKLFGNYQANSTSDDEFDDFDEFEM
jgi:hypothetical protein